MAKELKYMPVVVNIKNPSVFRRFLGFMIDLTIISYSFLSPLLIYLSYEIKSNSIVSLMDLKILVIITVIAFAYFFVFDYLVGSTIGEMIVGIEKIKNDSMESSIIYALFHGLFFVFPYLLVMEYLSYYFANFSLLEYLSKSKHVVVDVKYNQYVL